MSNQRRYRPRGRLVFAAIGLAAAVVSFGGIAGNAPGQELTKVQVDWLPIANGYPLLLGINKGFFAAQGLEIERKTFQSGNDIVLALANGDGDIGYIGYTPAMLARTQGVIPMSVLAASENEGATEADNWQNIVVDGSSPIRTPQDLVGKTLALNAFKGVAEVVVKGALEKRGINPDSVKYTTMPFPTMPTALANGLVDAIHTPEPFMSQVLARGGRVVMAPGPVITPFFPNGCYCAREDWIVKNPGLVKRFRTAINQSLAYSNSNPDEIRALLPAAIRNIRLPNWSPLIDRSKLVLLAQLAKRYGAIQTLPNMTKFAPRFVEEGTFLDATVGQSGFLVLRLNGKAVTRLRAGKVTIAVADKSRTDNFHLSGGSVNRSTSVAKRENATWTLNLKKGVYQYTSDGSSKKKGAFRVV
jgi:NitT/TauT family transport system substrate-binding protein